MSVIMSRYFTMVVLLGGGTPPLHQNDERRPPESTAYRSNSERIPGGVLASM
jgi:hypothetical protein